MNWPLGHVVENFPRNNGIVRKVMVKTKYGIYKRVVQGLDMLPVNK